MEKEEYIIKVADKNKCPCAKCVYGLFGGWSNWKCAKYPKGKPSNILYNNENCPYFEEITEEKSFKNFGGK